MVPGAPLKGVRGPRPGSPRVSGTLSGPVVEEAGAGRLDSGYLGSEKQSEVFRIGVKGGRRCLGSGRRPHGHAVGQRPRGLPLLSSERAGRVRPGQGSLGAEVVKTVVARLQEGGEVCGGRGRKRTACEIGRASCRERV